MSTIPSSHTGTLIEYHWPSVADAVAAMRNDDKEVTARRKQMQGAWAGSRAAKGMDKRATAPMQSQSD